MSVGEMSVGEMSVGEVSVGEMSVGEMSGYQNKQTKRGVICMDLSWTAQLPMIIHSPKYTQTELMHNVIFSFFSAKIDTDNK